MNEERTFGIEIECHSSVGDHRMAERIRQFFSDNMINHQVVVDGSYGHDTDASNESTWHIKPDGSVIALNENMSSQFPYNMEIVSPVLKGTEGMKAVQVVCKALDDGFGSPFATASRTCGFHVHHYVGGCTDEQLVKVANAWRVDEKFFYYALPNSRLSNTYCRQWGNPPECQSQAVYWYGNNIGDRRSSLNFRSISMRNTLEWRLHSGTVEWPKVSTWILITQRWLDIALCGGVVSSNTKTFKEFIDALKSSSIQVRRTLQRATPSSSDSDEPNYEQDFIRSAHSYVARSRFAQKFIHPEAKKQKPPKVHAKTGAIVRMLLSDWVTKEKIVTALNEEFGSLRTGAQKKFVSGQLTNLKNNKWGYGFNIIKNRKKFRLLPIGIEEIPITRSVPEVVEEPEEEILHEVEMSSCSNEQLEAVRFFLSRAQLFEGRRNPDNLGDYAFNESAEEQQEHNTSNDDDDDDDDDYELGIGEEEPDEELVGINVPDRVSRRNPLPRRRRRSYNE